VHDALGVAGAPAGQPGGEDLARLGVAQGHAHAAHAGADELRILADHADGYLGRLGARESRRNDAESRGQSKRNCNRSHHLVTSICKSPRTARDI
jgi:hypothetical protein